MTETTILDEGAVSEIEARAAKASKGPWESPANQQPWPDNAAHFEAIITADGGWIHRRNWKQVCLNMDFISHAREDIPALCATVKYLRAELNTTKGHWADTSEDLASALVKQDELQSQLEQLRAENERLNEAAERDRKHLNAKQSLLAGTQARLAQVEQERGVLSEALRTIEHPNVGAEDAKALKKIARQALEKL